MTRLIEGVEVEVDPRAVSFGGSWRWDASRNCPVPWDAALLEQFYKVMRTFAAPRILDIGANTGTYCLLAAGMPSARVVAFEPIPEVREVLEANVSLNHLEGCVRVLPYALSDHDGEAVLHIPIDKASSGFSCLGNPLRFKEWHDVTVPMRSLGNLYSELAALGIDRLDAIKIDTEGSELLILRGAEWWIRNCHPIILTEYHDINAHQSGYNRIEIRQTLERWGYNHFKESVEDLWCSISPLPF